MVLGLHLAVGLDEHHHPFPMASRGDNEDLPCIENAFGRMHCLCSNGRLFGIAR